ncbi:MAG: nucleoside recognition domain-containing protein, partial [Eubacteriales bacterium]
SFQEVEEGLESTSILASISSPFALLLIPLGFGTWQLAAAAITGFIAKENVVGTLAVVYSITNFIDVDELELVGGASDVSAVMGLTAVAALSYLMFNLFTPPCFAAIGAMNSEMNSKKWLWGGVGLQFGVAYVVAFLTYQIGTLMTEGTPGNGFLPGFIVTAILIGVVVMLIQKTNKNLEQVNG